MKSNFIDIKKHKRLCFIKTKTLMLKDMPSKTLPKINQLVHYKLLLCYCVDLKQSTHRLY
jgi:hypothetical protein